MGLGLFLGLALGGLGGGGPIPIGAGVGARTSGDVNALVGHSQPAEPQASEAPEGVTFPNFKPTEFPFVTTIPDDGTGKAGGYQRARVNLEFIRISLPVTYSKWYCPFTIQMPLRTEFMGKVDATRAATMSATIANIVGAGIDYKLPQGIFCERFRAGMQATFASTYPLLGASVTK
jgi:hypothetical protein